MMRGMVGDAIQRPARHQRTHRAPSTASGPVDAEQLAAEALGRELHGSAVGHGRSARPRSSGRPGPQRVAVLLDGGVGHGEQDVVGGRVAAQQRRQSGASFTTRRARSPMRSSSASTRSTDTTNRRSPATGPSRTAGRSSAR